MLEIALTVLVAIFLIVAAEGRHPYGFYMVLGTAATVGGAYWAVRVYHAGPRGRMWLSWLSRSCSTQSSR